MLLQKYIHLVDLVAPLHYLVPLKLLDFIEIGSLVNIPLGNRRAVGLIAQLLKERKPNHHELKSITSTVQKDPVLTEELIHLAKWISSYYYTSTAQVLEIMIPSAVKHGMGEKTKRYLSKNPAIITEDILKKIEKYPQQLKLFNYIQHAGRQIPLHETLKS